MKNQNKNEILKTIETLRKDSLKNDIINGRFFYYNDEIYNISFQRENNVETFCFFAMKNNFTLQASDFLTSNEILNLILKAIKRA